jgi:enamine deaminase RidA (YjgF/YER057c/UK114 family)
MEPAKRMLAQGACGRDRAVPRSGSPYDAAPCLLSDQQHSVVDLEKVSRVALMVTPEATGDVKDEAWEAISTIRAILRQQPEPMTVTMQTVFLRRAEDEAVCRRLFDAYYGERMPATSFVVQSPCGGQSLAIEAWALGGKNANVEFLAPDVVSVTYDGLRWIHLGGITPPVGVTSSYEQSQHVFAEMANRLKFAGASFRDVVRTWLYTGNITCLENGIERYRELNRARTEFFEAQHAQACMPLGPDAEIRYPASTGIGMASPNIDVGCLALQTIRRDVQLLTLENPRQTAAFDYDASFSIKSPKFSRAMAVVIGDYVTTWVSGTASIVDSESVYLGDAARQTEQTIDNIQNLIARENFARHGVLGAGAELSDLAKVRVYIKRLEDYEACREVCERRFGAIPTIYAQADVCRPELLVEIEGVAFSRCDF